MKFSPSFIFRNSDIHPGKYLIYCQYGSVEDLDKKIYFDKQILNAILGCVPCSRAQIQTTLTKNFAFTDGQTTLILDLLTSKGFLLE